MYNYFNISKIIKRRYFCNKILNFWKKNIIKYLLGEPHFNQYPVLKVN